MVIFQIVTRRQRRGAEIFSALLTEELIKRGHQVYFICLYKCNSDLLKVHATQLIELNEKRYRTFNIYLFIKLISIAIKYRPEIIQANGSDTLKYAIALKAILRNSKIVYRNISMVSQWIGNRKLIAYGYRLLFNHVDTVASVSEQSLNDLLRLRLISRNQGLVIHRGIVEPRVVSEIEIIRLRDYLDIPADARVLLHVGRFTKEKNHPFLLEVLQQIKRQNPNIVLVFAGEGPELAHIKALSFSKGIDSNVRFAGSISDLNPYYQLSEVLLLGSVIEGLPGVILEAGIHGKPCIAVNVGGITEVIINNETGVWISKHDSIEFAAHTCHLLNNRILLKSMGEQARVHIRSQFSLPAAADNFEKLYFKLKK